MMTPNKYFKFYLKKDVFAGVTVFLVALPLCLGIALASGAPLYAGLLSGIVGGIVVGLVSNSSLSVSGPAAGLTTLVASYIVAAGDYRTFLCVVVLAGVFQLLLGAFRLGVIANYFPTSVIKGMLAAIGLILIEKQIPLVIGWNKPEFISDNAIDEFTYAHFFNDFHNFALHVNYGALFLSGISLVLLIALTFPKFKKFKILPPTLIIVLIGIAYELITKGSFPSMWLDEAHLVKVPTNIFSEMVFVDFSKLFSSFEIWQQGLVIGIVASLETLLCVEAMDNLDPENRVTPVNRELIAQGVGNTLCGLIGAIPITAVIVRGSANVNAGAKTKVSAIIHGCLLLLTVTAIPFVLNKIPYASLAAILLVVGYNLTKPKIYIQMWKSGTKQFFPFLLTIVMILATDLLIGVILGLLFSIFFIIQENFKEQYVITEKRTHSIISYTVKMFPHVTFLNKVKLIGRIDRFPEYSKVTIDCSECVFIDHDIKLLLTKFRNKAHLKHIDLDIIGLEDADDKSDS